MTRILGIDTGGTYTDGVIVDAQSKEVLCKAKTMTTKHRLHQCIQNCIRDFPEKYLREISLVCLSTTLATHAIVEGGGCREGLILIGGKPEGKMPTDRYELIRGKMDIKGRLIENIQMDEVREAVERFRGQVDAIAISGYASVRNPGHEMLVKKCVQEQLGIPTACAHELTTSLGFYDRTVTADLNARLIPMICDLIQSVRSVMEECGIKAPVMLVKGDGTLMTEACARDKPIETILSGPAASIIGGIHLSGLKEAIVLDMGGTTTDIANVCQGAMKIRNEGAKVGGWFTHIKAAEVYTTGLGGDSRIAMDSHHRIHIGPKKCMPFCVMAKCFPGLREELRRIYQDPDEAYMKFHRSDTEAYFLLKDYESLQCDEEDLSIVNHLLYQPHTKYYLSRRLSVHKLSDRLNELVKEGILLHIAITPTDILHAEGKYKKWDELASVLALQILADQMGLELQECIRQIRSRIEAQMNCACLQGAFYFDQQNFDVESNQAAAYFIKKVFFEKQSHVLGGQYFLKKPVVAIGAPARAWSASLGHDLGTRVIVPEHAEVANAIGAAVGKVVDQSDVLIRPDPVTKKYIVFAGCGRKLFESLEEATAYAKESGRLHAQDCLPGYGCDISVDIHDEYIDDEFAGPKRIFVERVVYIRAKAKI